MRARRPRPRRRALGPTFTSPAAALPPRRSEHGHFDLGFVKDGKTIAQIAYQAGLHNKTLRKKAQEILNELRVHGAPDEMPGAPGPVYGKSY